MGKMKNNRKIKAQRAHRANTEEALKGRAEHTAPDAHADAPVQVSSTHGLPAELARRALLMMKRTGR